MFASLLQSLRRLFTGAGPQPPAAPEAPTSPPRDPDATVPLPELNTRPAPDAQPSRLPKPLAQRFTVGIGQDVGQVRPHNEDVLLTFTGELGGLEIMPNLGLFIVADGMGGHSLGERASGLAARAMARTALDQILPTLLADPQAEVDRPLLTEVMEAAMAAANRAVVTGVPEGGTTLTAALVIGDAVTRLLPGALGYAVGAHPDSHSPGLDGLLEGPQYTRPPVFRGDSIPATLLSGHHAQIDRWRREQALLATLQRRPDLLAAVPLTKLDLRFLREHGWQEPDAGSTQVRRAPDRHLPQAHVIILRGLGGCQMGRVRRRC